ncbi:c-type cytochrome [Marinobacter xestospongiae]|uniref:C-type cytochrome n=1 Tax=Marinobacter xestospongiae TaxID=994319 RepID=A0ABU3VWF8_9GAMM|nr:c-type cytochrome [Marinobacter xestospongiae]MDV2078594.1 c-type cytochrome [Marinobacter xestospongiae]
MKKLIAGVVLGVSLSAVAYGAGDPEAGKELVSGMACQSCHGQGGAQPMMGNYPKLAGMGEVYLTRQLKHIQDGTRNIPEMAGQLNGLSDQNLQDLAAYFDQQPVGLNQADPALVERGAAIYRGGNMASGVPACAGCHNPQGKGNEPAGYPRLSGQNAEYVAKQLRAFRDGERAATANAQIMADVASRLTDAEIEAVANYVSGLH